MHLFLKKIYRKNPFPKIYRINQCEVLNRKKTWLATTKGIAYFNWKNLNKIFYLTNKNQQTTSVSNINLDMRGQLWFTINRELLNYKPDSDELYIYRQEEVKSSNFSFSIKCRDDKGRIWLGTNSGIKIFSPDSINPYPFMPSIFIESIKINNDSLDINKNINEISSLGLKYNQNNLDISLVAVSYHLAKYNKIRYRLLDYNDKWIYIERGKNIRYVQIPYGDYTLEIQGINANNIKGKKRILNIEIAPPFWRTWWFPLLVILTIIAISLTIAHLYVQRKLKAQQIEMDKRAALNQQRNAIANDLHDDIGNDLSQIISMSDLALIKEQEEANEILNEIADLATESVKNLRYTMWSLDEKNNALSNVLFKLREYANLFAKRHDLQLVLAFPNQIPEQDLEGKQRRELFLFFKEALNNIKKYAEASTIDIIMKISDSNLKIQIKDNGKGFNLVEKKGTGKGLLTMEERAINLNGQLVIKTAPEEGTRLTLNIPIS